MEPQRVFVYGTLRRGGSNSFRMDGAELLGPAVVRGRLYHISWYPGIVLDPSAETVAGEIYQVSAARLAALDEFEGPEYRRVLVETTTAAGAVLSAWIWEWTLPVDGCRHITGGDWLENAGA